MNSFTDEQLVGQYLEGKHEQALEELVRRYMPLIFGFTKRYTGNQSVAADITQEVFVKVWKNLTKFDRAKSFRTWIFTIAQRTAIDELKKKQALPFSALGGEEDFSESLIDTAPSVVDQIFAQQQYRELATAVAQLPKNYRSVVELYTQGELNFREISARLHEPLNTIKSRYRRAIALLKKLV